MHTTASSLVAIAQCFLTNLNICDLSHMAINKNHWSCKRLSADAIRDSIRTEISDCKSLLFDRPCRNPVKYVPRGKAIWNANGGFVSVLLTHLFSFRRQFISECNSKRIIKICQHLPKLFKNKWHLFVLAWLHLCICSDCVRLVGRFASKGSFIAGYRSFVNGIDGAGLLSSHIHFTASSPDINNKCQAMKMTSQTYRSSVRRFQLATFALRHAT